MTGHKYKNRRRRRGDSGSQGGRGDQNSSYWNRRRYKSYEKFNQYKYPQLVFPQQWNHVSWENESQYSGTYRREPGLQNPCLPQHTFSPGQSHTRITGRASSLRGHSSWSDPRNRHNQEWHSSSSSSSRNESSSQQNVTPPPLGSEEARKKTLAEATDKIKSCLLSFENEKSVVLENLLSSEEQKIKESTRANPVRLERPGYAELQLTPSDLKVIGMVNTPGAGTSSELDVTGNYPIENISTNELLVSSNKAEIVAQNSDCSEKGLVSNDGCYTFRTPHTELLGSVVRGNMYSGLERETGLKDSSKETGRAPSSIYKYCGYTSESGSPGQLASGEVQASSSRPCAQFRSSSSICNAANDCNQSKDGMNIHSSYEHMSSSNESEAKRTLKDLKQRIIQQFLKMGKNNLKDVINNPRSRKFEFAMNHLMKEHRLVLSRELRALAQSRIRGKDVENKEQSETMGETDSLLDTDVAINLSHLPQEVIEQLGNLLQLNLLDDAQSMDFQRVTVEDESSVHDLQNIQALQVALLSEENIKVEVTENEMKPVLGREVTGNAVEENVTEKDLVEGQRGLTSDIQQNRSLVDEETRQIEETLRRITGEDEQEVMFEEGGSAKKPRKKSDGWPNYIPLGKRFMNRSDELGNLFHELTDLFGVGLTESEAVDGENNNVTDDPCTRQTDDEVDKHPQLESGQKFSRALDKVMNPNLASEANEAHMRPADEMADCNSSLETNVMPSNILNTEMGENSSESSSNTLAGKRVLERLATDCLTNTATGVKSCGGDKWIDASREEGIDGTHNTSDDIGTNFPASDVATKYTLEGCAHVAEPSECSAVNDGHDESSKNSGGTFPDNSEPLEGYAVAGEPIEDSGEPTGSLFEDGDVNSVNSLLGRISEEMNTAADNTGPRETEIEYRDPEELDRATGEVPKEKHATKEDSRAIENLVESPEKVDSNYGFEGKHVENLQTNLNTDGSDENSCSQLEQNEGNSCNVKGTLGRNQNGDAAVSDPPNEAMDTSFGPTSNGTENKNVANVNSSQFATADHSVNLNHNAEVSKSGVSSEADISHSRDIQADDISIDDLYGDLNDLPVSEDVGSSTVGKTQVDKSADNFVMDMVMKPFSANAEEMNGNSSSIVKSVIPAGGGSRGSDTHSAEEGTQLELSSNGTASSHETQDEIMEIYRCNVVVKTEKFDNATEGMTSVFEERHEVNKDAPRVVPEPEGVGSWSQTQSSFICNPIKQVIAVEASTQTQPTEEPDSYDVQRILQLLEKSSQLSPELSELLKDHFSSRKVTKEYASSESSRSVNTVSKDKSQLLTYSLNSTVSACPLIHVSEIHDRNSAIGTTPLPHASEPSYPVDGMEPSFRGPSCLGSKGKMNSTNQIKVTKQDDVSIGSNRVQKVRVGSKESEYSAGVNSFDAADASNPCATIGRGTDSDDNLSGDGVNTRRDVQETLLGSDSKLMFLKMLEIDKEIHKLMEIKLGLYRKFNPSLEIDSTCSDRNISDSPESSGLQFASPTAAASSQTLCNRVMLSNSCNTHQMQMGFVTMNNSEATGNTSGKPVFTSAPMVMLPVDYVLGSPAELQNTQLSLPRQKPSECLKTSDTSVVEAVPNRFNPPDHQSRGEDDAVIHSSDHKNQSKMLGDDNEPVPLKLKSDLFCGNSINEDGRNLVPHFPTHKESHQSETNSSSKDVSLKKKVSKPRLNINKECQSGHKKEQSHVKHKTGITMNKRSLRPVGSRERRCIESRVNVTAGKAVQSDSLMQTPVEELQNGRQTEICQTKDQRENVSRRRSTRQKVENINCEKESSLSDSSTVVEDRKETRSSVKTEVSTKDNKQSENDRSLLSNSSRSCERMFPQADKLLCRSRRDTRSASLSDVEFQLNDAAETVDSRKRETRSSKERNYTSFDESEASDSVTRVTRKRRLTVETEISNESYEELTKPATEIRSRRSCTRSASNFQNIQPAVMDGKGTEGGGRMKAVKVEQAPAEPGRSLPSRQVKKTSVSNSGQPQNSKNCNIQSSSEVLNSGLSSERFPSSRSRQHIGDTQKRKGGEIEGPPSKVQRLNPKLDIMQRNLQDCFVLVKPLAVETVAQSVQSEELATTNHSSNQRSRRISGATNSLGNQRSQRISGTTKSLGTRRSRRTSSSSDEVPVAELVRKNKKRSDKKEEAAKHKFDDSDDCCRVDFPELADVQHTQVEVSSSEQDPLGGILDAPICQPQSPELLIEPCGNIRSGPVQLSSDLLVQPHLPGHLQEHCILPEIVVDDENSISSFLSDTVSVTSDGEQSIAKRSRNYERSRADLLTHFADGKNDYDQDSSYSCDTSPEVREGIKSTESKHKTLKKHKKDRKSDGIERLVFESHEGPILDIKTVGRHVLAASEDGNVYCYSLKSGKCKRKYEGHRAAVTCLCVTECSNSSVGSELGTANGEQMAPHLFFTGSLDKHLRTFRFKTGELVQNPVDVGNPIQCMDQNWGILYIGTQAGEVIRFNVKTSSLIGEAMKIERGSILTLKATKEGPRQVLIIGSRNKPIAVRDAATGLLLRTVCNNWSHTVYSLVLSTGLVYCGTKTGSIPAIEFTTGDEVCKFKTAAGVVCIRIYNNLLFAGCYDGNIYVFNIQDKTQVASIPGPGKMLLCMDIIKNRIIAGSKDSNKLEAWAFPQEIRSHLKEAKHK